jgi:2-polyprenyl-6-methoxyphenol hydroxylase-like FAD-dependent oxidoreductase
LLDEIHERGTVLRTLSWRKVTGEAIATHDRYGDEEQIVVSPVPELTQFLLEKLEEYPTASVLFHHRVWGVGTTDDQAWVDVDIGNNDVKKMSGDFVLGCDGEGVV